MIGIYFAHRRKEFLQFACKHPIDYIELFDLSMISDYKIDTLYIDGPADIAGPFTVIDVKNIPFTEIFTNTVDISSVMIKSSQDILFQFDIFQKYVKQNVSSFNLSPLSDEVDMKHESISEQERNIPISHEDILVNKVSSYIPEELDISDLDNAFDHTDGSTALKPKAETECLPEIYEMNALEDSESISRPVVNGKKDLLVVKPTDIFSAGNKAAPSVIKSTSLPLGFVHTRGSTSKKRFFQVPIFTFCGLTDKAGVSTIALSLAVSLALSKPSAKILYLDLDISNPNYILNFLNLNPETDASVKTAIQLTETEFVQNISLLTETVNISQATFSVITWGQTTFQEKRELATQDFNFFLSTICNSFDVILVDLGKLQSTLEYQLNLLASNTAKHILLADGSTNRNVNVFIQLAKQLSCNFEVVVNKDIPQSGSFAIRQQLRQAPIASIGLHRNIERYLNNQLPLQGTSFESDLINLGGKL